MINYGKFAVALFGKTWSYGQCGHLSALPMSLNICAFFDEHFNDFELVRLRKTYYIFIDECQPPIA